MDRCIALKFFRHDRTKSRESIYSIVKKIPISPDGIWVCHNSTSHQDGFEYTIDIEDETSSHVEKEINQFLYKIVSIKPEIDLALGSHNTVVLVTVYTNGSIYSTISFDALAMKLANAFEATIDIDIYVTKDRQDMANL